MAEPALLLAPGVETSGPDAAGAVDVSEELVADVLLPDELHAVNASIAKTTAALTKRLLCTAVSLIVLAAVARLTLPEPRTASVTVIMEKDQRQR